MIEPLSLFNSKETNALNGPQNIDGEYYSDMLAYRPSMQSHWDFLQAKSAYSMYVGSISSKRFASQNQLKIHNSLGGPLSFELRYIEKENFEEAREQLAIGLSYALHPKIETSFYTSLFSRKENNDFGLNLKFHLNPRHRLNLFTSWIDFDFNKRNEIKAKDQKSPMHLGFMGTYQSLVGPYFWQYYFYHNTAVQREFSQESTTYYFEEWRWGGRGRVPLMDVGVLNIDVDFFSGTEGRLHTDAASLETGKKWDRYGHRILSQWERGLWTFGLEHNYRLWQSEQGQVRHNNWMPHLWKSFIINPNQKGLWPSRTELGLETSWHRAAGASHLRSDTDQDRELNTRFNLRLFYQLAQKAHLNFLLSADLDDFSWEGGGSQLQVLF